MATFRVQMTRTVTEYVVVEVEADNAEHAKTRAKDRVLDNPDLWTDSKAGRQRVSSVEEVPARTIWHEI